MQLLTSWYAVLGAVIVSATAALVGSFLVLQKRSLLVDMLGHAVFPGVILGFLLAGWQRSSFWFFVGALFTIVAGYLLFVILSRSPKVGDDAATAISLSGMFAIGATLLSWIQQHAAGAQAGLNTFLTGQAALISRQDVLLFSILFLLLSLFLVWFHRPLKVWVFDSDFAYVSGASSKAVIVIFYVLTGFAVFFSVQAVGVVLASALFILAPLTVLLWAKRFETLLIISVVTSVVGTFVGAFWSGIDERMPTGAAIIAVLFLFFIFSWVFAPNGLLKSYWSKRQSQAQHLKEDLLKSWYYFYEANGFPGDFFLNWETAFSRTVPCSRPRFFYLKKLLAHWCLRINPQGFELSEKGIAEAISLVRRHRLWESYLVSKMGFSPDHVHENAESVEHFIGEELEGRIEAELGEPLDPHGKPIPKSQKGLKEGL